MSLKIDFSNAVPSLSQHQDQRIVKKDTVVVKTEFSSYESKEVGNNLGEEIWRPVDGPKNYLHPILSDRWGRVQTVGTSDKPEPAQPPDSVEPPDEPPGDPVPMPELPEPDIPPVPMPEVPIPVPPPSGDPIGPI